MGLLDKMKQEIRYQGIAIVSDGRMHLVGGCKPVFYPVNQEANFRRDVARGQDSGGAAVVAYSWLAEPASLAAIWRVGRRMASDTWKDVHMGREIGIDEALGCRPDMTVVC